MAVLNVDDVFRFVQFVANKESRGWVSPSEFNIAAELSQIAVYSRLESMFLSNKKIHNDMRPFLKKDVITWGGVNYTMPANWRQILGLYVVTSLDPLNEITLAEEPDYISSTIVAPTTDYPAYLIQDGGILVYPATMQLDLGINYIQNLSTTPTWAYTIVSGRPVYSAGTSVQFEFEDNLFLEISMLIIANVGMNIKAETVTQYGMAFNKAA